MLLNPFSHLLVKLQFKPETCLYFYKMKGTKYVSVHDTSMLNVLYKFHKLLYTISGIFSLLK